LYPENHNEKHLDLTHDDNDDDVSKVYGYAVLTGKRTENKIYHLNILCIF